MLIKNTSEAGFVAKGGIKLAAGDTVEVSDTLGIYLVSTFSGRFVVVQPTPEKAPEKVDESPKPKPALKPKPKSKSRAKPIANPATKDTE